jgi:hypothetical protein
VTDGDARQPANDRLGSDRDSSIPPPLPGEELMEVDGDIVIIQVDPEADMRGWSEAFALSTKSGRQEKLLAQIERGPEAADRRRS